MRPKTTFPLGPAPRPWIRPPDAAEMTQAVTLIQALLADLDAWSPGVRSPVHDLSHLAPAARRFVDDMLRIGEVALSIDTDQGLLRAMEVGAAGVWRLRYPDGAEFMEIGDVPAVVRDAAWTTAEAVMDVPETVPEGAGNALALLGEIDQAMKAGSPRHVVELTHLPLTEADWLVLDEVLGDGPIGIASGGVGRCAIRSTGLRRVWRLAWWNDDDTPKLDIVEVADVPQAAAAAHEDIQDARTRLDELLSASVS